MQKKKGFLSILNFCSICAGRLPKDRLINLEDRFYIPVNQHIFEEYSTYQLWFSFTISLKCE